MRTAANLIDGPRAFVMWGLGVLAYIVAVMQRTSFGVAGVAAGERFEAGASIVSLFAVVQLLTYAAMQIPAGVLVDRFGTRAIVGVGAVLMFLGQLDLAFSESLVSAVIARVLVGTGDAMTFTSVLRLLPAWFSPRRAPLLTQLTGMLGQGGQLLSAIPVAALLAARGWTPTFVAAAVTSGVVAALVILVVRNTPPGVSTDTGTRPQPVAHQVAAAMRVPGTWLGFFIQWTCASWALVFAIMWGYPFLRSGLGYSQSLASAVLSVSVIAAFVFGPLIGSMSRSHPLQRTNIAIATMAFVALAWLVVLLWPGVAPLPVVLLLMVGIAAAGPASVVSVDVARTANPGRQLGTATGIAVSGAFLAALLNIWTIGLVIDLRGGYSLINFKWAFASQFVFMVIGLVGAYWARARARSRDAARGVRYRSLASGLRTAFAHERVVPAGISVPVDDGREIRVAAVLPGVGGQLTALDVVDGDPGARWWSARVADYLDIAASPLNDVASIQVECTDRATVPHARELIRHELGTRGSPLVVEVTSH